MKLLIADDEALTRSGLISSIDWQALGINHIFQADDGRNALDIIRKECPDIVLSDIRMPRLNGIQMAEELERIMPDISLIFMSGYSDKEYLKAAIKLKAVSYVEKPLNPDEVKEAVQEAINLRQQKLRTRQNETLHSMATTSNLALLLTKPFNDSRDKIEALTADLSLRILPGFTFTTYIVKLRTAEPDISQIRNIRNDLDRHLKYYHLQAFYIQQHLYHHIFHIMGSNEPSATALSSIDTFLASHFAALGDFFVIRGDTVTGIARAYHSYNSAIVTLQHSFFFSPDMVHTAADEKFSVLETAASPLPDEAVFSEALLAKDEPACQSFLAQLHRHYSQNVSVLMNQMKDVYYKLFMIINFSREKLKLTMDFSKDNQVGMVLDAVEKCFTYDELHGILVQKTTDFFKALTTRAPEDSIIFSIKDYISKNYANEALSIKEISDHVFLSTSYVCTYFKSQTGQTLNQYLTDYRMNIAMQLLEDARYQITDISSKVGYSNGNYFSKSFRKYTGMSPSKYREKMLE